MYGALSPSDEKLEALLFDSFLIHLPDNTFPLNFDDITRAQAADQVLQQLQQASPDNYQMKEFANCQLLCIMWTLSNVAELLAQGQSPHEWKVCIPNAS